MIWLTAVGLFNAVTGQDLIHGPVCTDDCQSLVESLDQLLAARVFHAAGDMERVGRERIGREGKNLLASIPC